METTRRRPSVQIAEVIKNNGGREGAKGRLPCAVKMSAVKITAVDMKPMSASGVCLIQICKMKGVWCRRAWYTTGAQHDSMDERSGEHARREKRMCMSR